MGYLHDPDQQADPNRLRMNTSVSTGLEADRADFTTAFRGRFIGVLQWPELDELWATLLANDPDNWYVYAIGEAVPQQVASAAELKNFLTEINRLLRKEHQEDYCGIVYTDSRTSPQFIKIFDPNNLGVVCGFSDNPPLPGWVLSKIKPQPLEDLRPLPGNRKRWWKRLRDL